MQSPSPKQTTADLISALSAYRQQLLAIAEIEAETLSTQTQLAAVRSQLAGLKEATSGLSLSQYRTIKNLDERIFSARKEIEALEIAIPKAQAELNAHAAVNAETKHRHNQIEADILQFRNKIKGTE